MRRIVGLSVCAILAVAASAGAADRSLGKESFTFGTLTPPSEASVRMQAAKWLKEQDKLDRQAFDAVWSNKDKPVLDRLAATFEKGDKDAAAPLNASHGPNALDPPPRPDVVRNANG